MILTGKFYISKDNLFILLLKIYFISLLFLYPYGIKELGLRITDIIAIPLIFLGLLIIFKKKEINNIIFLLPIIPLFLFEIIYPLLGVIYFSSYEPINSSLRMLLLYFPILLFCFTTNQQELVKFDQYIEKILKIAVWCNLIYSVIQNLVIVNLLPRFFLITELLIPYAVDDHFRVIDGIRASGFFVNTTALAIFSAVAMIYFSAKYLASKSIKYSIYILISILLVILTTSRAILLVTMLFLLILIIAALIKLKSISRVLRMIIGLTIGGLIAYIYLQKMFDLDVFFERLTRIGEGGLENDLSFSYRSDYLWPHVLSEASKHFFGTLENSQKVIGLIDSGYLTYYAQGKFIGIACVALLLIQIFIIAFKYFRFKTKWGLFLIGILTLILIAAVVNNPFRSPIIIFFLCYGFISYNFEMTNSHKKQF